MTVQPKLVTVSEFEEFIRRPENEERCFELLDGRILENVPTEELGVVTVNIGTEFRLYARQHGGRAAVEARHNNFDDPYNDRIPDVSYTSAARMLPLVKEGAVPQMPDVAVEVKSLTIHTRRCGARQPFTSKTGRGRSGWYFLKSGRLRFITKTVISKFWMSTGFSTVGT